MLWDELKELDGPEPTWEMTGNPTKNGLPHVVPLSRPVVEILRGIPGIGRSRFVFTTDGKHHVSGFSKAKSRLDTVIAKRRAEEGLSEPMPEFVIHDLRRTVSTRMHEELCTPPHIVEAVPNHVSGHRSGVAGTYNRAHYLDEKRKALTAWAEYVQRLVEAGA